MFHSISIYRSERPALEVAKLAAAVLGTMSVVFAPFYFADAAGIDGVAAVFTMLAPFKRGLFEVRVYFKSRTGN